MKIKKDKKIAKQQKHKTKVEQKIIKSLSICQITKHKTRAEQ
jgi:hypothetical protein